MRLITCNSHLQLRLEGRQVPAEFYGRLERKSYRRLWEFLSSAAGAALRGRALGGSTETPSPTPRRDGRSAKVARSRLPPPPPSERCAEVSTVTFPMRGRCPSSLAASHAHVWACSRAQERRVPTPRFTIYSASALGRWDPSGGKAGGRGARSADWRPPGRPGKTPGRRSSSMHRPYRRWPHWGSVCFACCSPGSVPVCKIVINRISVLCVLVVAMRSRPN